MSEHPRTSFDCPYCGPLRTTLEPEQHEQLMIVAMAKVLSRFHNGGEDYPTTWEHLDWHIDRLDALWKARHQREAVTA